LTIVERVVITENYSKVFITPPLALEMILEISKLLLHFNSFVDLVQKAVQKLLTSTDMRVDV